MDILVGTIGSRKATSYVKLCGLEINADYNASINISQKDIVNYPNVATSELVTSQRL